MLHTIKSKSPQDLLLRSRNDDVIATSPWMRVAGELPHRIVIRDLTSTFVVHQQIIMGEGVFFESGNYYEKTDGDALERAFDKFMERSKRQGLAYK